ncbi:MAG: hypothetical protein ABI398_02170 [Devosia sp.]
MGEFAGCVFCSHQISDDPTFNHFGSITERLKVNNWRNVSGKGDGLLE